MRILIIVLGLLMIPTLLPAQDAASYWRDRQYADRVRSEERRHELEILRIRSQAAIEVAKQNRRYYHYYRPRIVGHQVNVLLPDVTKTTVITYQSSNHSRARILTRGVRHSESSVKVTGPGFSYSSSKKKRVTRIGIGN